MRDQQSGFSLIELMVTLTVAGIILGMGVPSFIYQVKNGRLTSAVNEVVAAMHLSRSEASKRRIPVVMCTSTTALNTDAESCDNGANWNDGWIVFADLNSNNLYDGADDIIRRHGPQNSDLRVISHEQIENTITYMPTGFAQLPLNIDSGRFIVYCTDDNEDRYSRVLSFSNSGRPNIMARENTDDAPTCSGGT